MHIRTLLSGALAVLLLTGSAVSADERAASPGPIILAGFSLPGVGLPRILGGKKTAPVQLAQAGDPRVTTLEEQVRSLSGTIEELNFQILQMQEQLRKMQEDNEFRFQELEKKKSDAGGKTDRNVAEAAPPAKGAGPADTAEAAPKAGIEEIIVDSGTDDPATDANAVPPKTFGTITFDEKGNVTGGSVGDQISSGEDQIVTPPTSAEQADNTIVAALPATDDPEELYRNSYEFILSGDYGTAESGFREHIKRFPADAKTADARFWLGESLLGQKKYRDAAEIFLAANKEYPSSKKAPDMLLKLGVSLVGLDQHDVACATFSAIGKRYPDIGGPLKDRVKQEQALAAC